MFGSNLVKSDERRPSMLPKPIAIQLSLPSELSSNAQNSPGANKSSYKRGDVQCLRCVAILGVLGQHLFGYPSPSYALGPFTNGYLGVDIFFVISGFMMAQICNRSKIPFGFAHLADFYRRRLIRLVPAYCLDTLAILALATFCIKSPATAEPLYTDLKAGVERSIVFAYNLYAIFSDLDKSVGVGFVAPHWSLAAEMQYYLLAPFVMVVLSRMHARHSFMQFSVRAFPLFVLVPSALYYGLMPIHAKFAQFSMPTRIWQFHLGAASYFAVRSSPQGMFKNFATKLKILYTLLFTNLLATVFFPYTRHSELIARPIVAGSTALLIYLGAFVHFTCEILWPFGYLGNISYSLYLVHYPPQLFFRYTMGLRAEPTPTDVALSIIIGSTFIASLQYELIEKKAAKMNWLALMSTVAIGYIMIALFLLY